MMGMSLFDRSLRTCAAIISAMHWAMPPIRFSFLASMRTTTVEIISSCSGDGLRPTVGHRTFSVFTRVAKVSESCKVSVSSSDTGRGDTYANRFWLSSRVMPKSCLSWDK